MQVERKACTVGLHPAKFDVICTGTLDIVAVLYAPQQVMLKATMIAGPDQGHQCPQPECRVAGSSVSEGPCAVCVCMFVCMNICKHECKYVYGRPISCVSLVG